jgi:hypothetical protein
MFSITRHHWWIVFLLSIDIDRIQKISPSAWQTQTGRPLTANSGAKTIEEAKAIAQADHDKGNDARP